MRDIQDACDILMLIYERMDKLDRHVSLEVAPELAYDTEGTIARWT